jgi:hypothetical protein
MRSYYEKIVILFLLMLSIASCSRKHDDVTWDIIAVGLPKIITPSVANINMGLYILKQTHEPFFRYRKRTELYSNLFKTWNRDLKYQRFNFCLKNDLYFNEEKKYTIRGLKSDLMKVIKKFNSEYKLNIKNNCIKISFNKSQNNFLDILTKYENSPSHSLPSSNWEDGLGPFYITGMGIKKISLERKEKVSNGYNFINFWSYSGANDNILNQDGIEDYNRVLIQDLPTEKLKDYQKFNVALLQTINLVLNIKDRELRKNLFNCMDISDFRKAFMPKQKNFLDVGSILPIGIPFSKQGKIAQDCDFSSIKRDEVIKFYNWNKSSSISLKGFFTNLKRKTGLNIEVIDISMNQFVDMVLKSPHPYDLTVVALDAIDVNYNAYFSPVIDKKSILDVKRKRLDKLYNKFKDTKPNEFSVRSITSAISKEHLLLPLYQEVRDFYFPKHVKALTLGKNDLEYLEINELEL